MAKRKRAAARGNGGSRAFSVFMALVIIAVLVCGAVQHHSPHPLIKPKDEIVDSSGDTGNGGNNDNGGTINPVKPTDSGVVNDAGLYLSSGNLYSMPRALVYSLTSEESATASEGVTLQATILPLNIAEENYDVYWMLSWKDETDPWVAGKTAGDYVQVIQNPVDKKQATVYCKEAFGSTIDLECMAIMKGTEQFVSDLCEIDYMQRFTSVSLNIGNTNVQLVSKDAIMQSVGSGEPKYNFSAYDIPPTTIAIDVENDNTNLGGQILTTAWSSGAYSIEAPEPIVTVTLHDIWNDYMNGRPCPSFFAKKNLETGEQFKIVTADALQTGSLYFDRRLFSQLQMSYIAPNETTETALADMDVSQLVEVFKSRQAANGTEYPGNVQVVGDPIYLGIIEVEMRCQISADKYETKTFCGVLSWKEIVADEYFDSLDIDKDHVVM